MCFTVPQRSEFPDFSVECPVTYIRDRQQYRVDFNFSIPFSPASQHQLNVFRYIRGTYFGRRDDPSLYPDDPFQFQANIDVSFVDD